MYQNLLQMYSMCMQVTFDTRVFVCAHMCPCVSSYHLQWSGKQHLPICCRIDQLVFSNRAGTHVNVSLISRIWLIITSQTHPLMSAGSPTVRLLLLTQSIPLTPLLLLFSSLFPSLSALVFLPICLRLSSLPSFLCFSSRFSVSSFLSSSFFSFFFFQDWRVYSRRSWADTDFPAASGKSGKERKSLLILLIYTSNMYFFYFNSLLCNNFFPQLAFPFTLQLSWKKQLFMTQFLISVRSHLQQRK